MKLLMWRMLYRTIYIRMVRVPVSLFYVERCTNYNAIDTQRTKRNFGSRVNNSIAVYYSRTQTHTCFFFSLSPQILLHFLFFLLLLFLLLLFFFFSFFVCDDSGSFCCGSSVGLTPVLLLFVVAVVVVAVVSFVPVVDGNR
jgi:hypothetical protein